MPALTVHDLLGQVIQFHRTCVEQYEAAAGRAQDPQVPALLKYLATHERRLATNIERYERDTPSGVLATWLPFSASLKIGASLAFPVDADVTEAVSVALLIDDLLVQFCRALSDQSEFTAVKDLFHDIAAQEETLKSRAVVAAVELVQG